MRNLHLYTHMLLNGVNYYYWWEQVFIGHTYLVKDYPNEAANLVITELSPNRHEKPKERSPQNER